MSSRDTTSVTPPGATPMPASVPYLSRRFARCDAAARHDQTEQRDRHDAARRGNPWPGLDAFDESAHRFFLGRDAEASHSAAKRARFAGHRTLRTIGPRQDVLAPGGALPGTARERTSCRSTSAWTSRRTRCRSPTSFASACGRRSRTRCPDAPLPGDERRLGVPASDRCRVVERPQLPAHPRPRDRPVRGGLHRWGSRLPGWCEEFRHDFGDLVENRIPADLMRLVSSTARTRLPASPCGRGTTSC